MSTSVLHGFGTAAPSAKSGPRSIPVAVSIGDLERLARDWQKQADTAERVQTDRNMDATMKRVLAMQARVLDVCIADLRDLIHGRPHPDKRRAEQLPLGRETKSV